MGITRSDANLDRYKTNATKKCGPVHKIGTNHFFQILSTVHCQFLLSPILLILLREIVSTNVWVKIVLLHHRLILECLLCCLLCMFYPIDILSAYFLNCYTKSASMGFLGYIYSNLLAVNAEFCYDPQMFKLCETAAVVYRF